MEAASRDISAQRGRGLPTFSLTGSSSKVTQDEVLGGNQTLDTVGVSFSWPLFQGGAVASAVRQSRALYRQAQAAYDAAQRDTERQTRAAFRGIVSGIQRIGAARRAVDSGHDAVEASRRNVEFGTGTEFDLLNAQNNYYAARARLQSDALRLFDQRADAQTTGRPLDRARSARHRRPARGEPAHEHAPATQGTRHAARHSRTGSRDRTAKPWMRHRKLALVGLAVASRSGSCSAYLLRYSGAGVSVDRSRLSIATVERGSFVRDIAADGQVVAAVSPTLYANAAWDGHAQGARGRHAWPRDRCSPSSTVRISPPSCRRRRRRWRACASTGSARTLDADHKLAQLRDAYDQAQVDQKTAQRELDRSRKAYELGSYSELQALKAQDSLEKAQFAFEQAKTNYESQPKQNRFDIDSKKALLDRQQFLVADLKRQVEG